jgi:hypothetical protein
VDLATGRLGRAIAKTAAGSTSMHDRHPETGAVIEGFLLPHWESVCQLAIRTHDALDRIICVGWDVAILADGPVIVEGNDNPGRASSQLPTGIALGETPVVSTLLARLAPSFTPARPAGARVGRRSGTVPTLPGATSRQRA